MMHKRALKVCVPGLDEKPGFSFLIFHKPPLISP